MVNETFSRSNPILLALVITGLIGLGSPDLARASSHCESPFVAPNPELSQEDKFLFQSYDAVCIASNELTAIIIKFRPIDLTDGEKDLFELEAKRLKSLEGQWQRLFRTPGKPPEKAAVKAHCRKVLAAPSDLRRFHDIDRQIEKIRQACGRF